MLILAFFPNIITKITSIIGILDGTNTVFMLEGMFVLLILLSLTSIVSQLNEQNRKIAQKMGIIEKRLREIEEKQKKV